MRYKLLGLEQLTRIKERWFQEALRQRLRGYARFLSFRGEAQLDADDVRMRFTRSDSSVGEICCRTAILC